MTTQLKPEMAARIDALAEHLGLTGLGSRDLILRMALDALETQTGLPRRKLTQTEIDAEKEYWAKVGKRNRALYPFDDDNPPSKFLQDELYDKSGLPK